jgi:hypothetical protein
MVACETKIERALNLFPTYTLFISLFLKINYF